MEGRLFLVILYTVYTNYHVSVKRTFQHRQVAKGKMNVVSEFIQVTENGYEMLDSLFLHYIHSFSNDFQLTSEPINHVCVSNFHAVVTVIYRPKRDMNNLFTDSPYIKVSSARSSTCFL